MAGLEQSIKKLALDEGVAAVGISTVDRLGREPSMDPNYVLPGARSLVSLMIPLDGALIRSYLGKENHEGLEDHDRILILLVDRQAQDLDFHHRRHGSGTSSACGRLQAKLPQLLRIDIR